MQIRNSLEESQVQQKLTRFLRKFSTEVAFEVSQCLAEAGVDDATVHSEICEAIERVTVSYIQRVKTSTNALVSDEYQATRTGGPLYALLHLVDRSLERMTRNDAA